MDGWTTYEPGKMPVNPYMPLEFVVPEPLPAPVIRTLTPGSGAPEQVIWPDTLRSLVCPKPGRTINVVANARSSAPIRAALSGLLRLLSKEPAPDRRDRARESLALGAPNALGISLQRVGALWQVVRVISHLRT